MPPRGPLNLTIREDSLSVQHNVTHLHDFLYVGGDDICDDNATLRDLGITHIINCTSTVPNYFPDEFKYLQLSVKDTTEAQISPYFADSFDMIEDAKQSRGACLVHCQEGMSRSTTICIAYMVANCGMSLMEALEYTKCRRPVTAPNIGFMAQLTELERATHGYTSLDMEKYNSDRFADLRSFAVQVNTK